MGSGGKEKSNGRNRSGSILSGRSRSGSILAEGNGRQRGQSVSKVVEQDAMGGGSSPKPSSPKPGIFSSVSFTSRKRGNSKSSVTDHYTNSEDYNSNNTTSPSRGYINPRAEKYLQEVFVVPGTAVSPRRQHLYLLMPPPVPRGKFLLSRLPPLLLILKATLVTRKLNNPWTDPRPLPLTT